MNQRGASFKRKSDEAYKSFAEKRRAKDKQVNDFMAKVLAKSKSRFSAAPPESSTDPASLFSYSMSDEIDLDLSDGDDFVDEDSETEDNDLRTYEDDNKEDVECVNPFDEIDETNSRRVEMNEAELIMMMLLLQGRFDTPNSCTELSCKIINDFGTKKFSTSDWDTLAKRVPNAFCLVISKYFYSNCGELIGPVLDTSKSATCKHNHPSCRIIPNEKMSQADGSKYFCYVSMTDWLLHQIPVVHPKLLINRKGRKRKYFHDLHCCSNYDSLVKSNDESITLTITLTWDGVAYNKNQKSMWPLCVYLNELPFTDRINNPMLIALHSGQTKPDSDIMLSPLVDELVRLQVEPLSVRIDDQVYLFKVKLLLIIADAPARALILNCNQHNSYYACHTCLLKGTYERRFFKMTFPPTVTLKAPRRNNEEWRKIATKLSNESSNKKKKQLKGIKGRCQIMRLSYVDLSTICPPEAMHSQYLGTVKSLTNRWLARDCSTKWFGNLTKEEKQSVNKYKLSPEQISQIDEHLSSIKFPEGVHRYMPQFSRNCSLKSLEYELVLFFGWVCYDGILEKKRLANFKQLAFILSSLSMRYVPQSDRSIEKEIKIFYEQFKSIYTKHESFMWKINVHFISHMREMVESFGPLPVQTAYFTEDLFGRIARKNQTGTKVSEQTMKKCNTYQSVVSACSSNIQKCSQKFLKNLYPFLPNLCDKVERKIKSYSFVYTPTSDEILMLSKTGSSMTYKSLMRVLINGKLICTEDYNKSKANRTNNHCIKTEKGKYFIVSKIIEATNLDTNCSSINVLCYELTNCKRLPLRPDDHKCNLYFSYISTYTEVQRSMLSKVESSEIFELATYTTVNNISYVFDIFNKHL